MENTGARINMAIEGEWKDLGEIARRETAGEKYMFLVRASEGVIERYVPADYYAS